MKLMTLRSCDCQGKREKTQDWTLSCDICQADMIRFWDEGGQEVYSPYISLY